MLPLIQIDQLLMKFSKIIHAKCQIQYKKVGLHCLKAKALILKTRQVTLGLSNKIKHDF